MPRRHKPPAPRASSNDKAAPEPLTTQFVHRFLTVKKVARQSKNNSARVNSAKEEFDKGYEKYATAGINDQTTYTGVQAAVEYSLVKGVAEHHAELYKAANEATREGVTAACVEHLENLFGLAKAAFKTVFKAHDIAPAVKRIGNVEKGLYDLIRKIDNTKQSFQ